MAIQQIDLAVPNGDTVRSANIKINQNFSDPTHAASKLVGAGRNQVPLGSDVMFASLTWNHNGNVTDSSYFDSVTSADIRYGMTSYTGVSTFPNDIPPSFMNTAIITTTELVNSTGRLLQTATRTSGASQGTIEIYRTKAGKESAWTNWQHNWTTQNATKDPNGFIKSSSPIAEIYSDKMDLNDDAKKQGGITFEKLGVGDYLVKGSLGFAQEGWYIEMPKDANGNVLVAVVYEQLENNDLSIKTYAKKFDDETGDIVANVTKPRDIPDGRFISLRLHEEPQIEEPETGV